jgi:hypothetical protein
MCCKALDEMPIGICKLCLKSAALQKSHLLPSAMWRITRDASRRNPNPVLVGKEVTTTTSRQISDYLLCAQCEELFSKHGESWIMRQVWNGRHFPLADKLKGAIAHYQVEDARAFSSTAAEIDADKLAYFALSVIWRAGVHEWTLPHNGKMDLLDLGPAEEQIRRYLLGESPFPDRVGVIVNVCDDQLSKDSLYPPCPYLHVPGLAYSMMTRGVNFLVFVNVLDPSLRAWCCIGSTTRLIWLRDCSRKMIDTYAHIFKTSRIAKGLSEPD